MCFSSGGDRAASRAARAQARQNALTQAFMERIYADEAPFRELELERGRLGASFFPELKKQIENPTLSPGYNVALNKGLDALRSKFSATGSPSSGPAQVAGGEFATGITNNELDRFNENLFRIAGYRGAPSPSQAPQILNTIQAGTNNLTDLMMARQSGGFPWASLAGAGAGVLTQLPWGSLFKSSRSTKDDVIELDDSALKSIFDDIERISIYQWKYKPEIDSSGQIHIGPTVEDSPDYMRHDELSLDPINYLGALLITIKVLAGKVKKLEERYGSISSASPK